MNSGQLLLTAAGVIIISGIAFVLFGILSGTGGAPTALPSVEVRSYQGVDLS
jgi:hypothetical protein